MEDVEEEDNWVEFIMIESGDTSTDDQSHFLHYLTFFSTCQIRRGDGELEMIYLGTHTWMVIASGKETQTTMIDGLAKKTNPIQIGNWWYYCELHEGDWYCTDDYGQSSDYANSATTTDTSTDTMVEMTAAQMTSSL